MSWPQGRDRVEKRCYPGGGGIARFIVGIVLVGLGGVLILLCVPFWAWLAILGGALVLVGLVLIRK